MKISFLEIAQHELDEAIAYYNSQRTGLGDEFLLEILRLLDRIGEFPEAWHPISKNVRRCRLRQFPYGILYQVRKSTILIIAVAHLHRKPFYWQDRV
ncbi:MAG: type II toxin-antitoxin system RelE/ParE family toxin [Spirochaetota bacterium]